MHLHHGESPGRRRSRPPNFWENSRCERCDFEGGNV